MVLHVTAFGLLQMPHWETLPPRSNLWGQAFSKYRKFSKKEGKECFVYVINR